MGEVEREPGTTLFIHTYIDFNPFEPVRKKQLKKSTSLVPSKKSGNRGPVGRSGVKTGFCCGLGSGSSHIDSK